VLAMLSLVDKIGAAINGQSMANSALFQAKTLSSSGS
jgi:hypothetical protein